MGTANLVRLSCRMNAYQLFEGLLLLRRKRIKWDSSFALAHCFAVGCGQDVSRSFLSDNSLGRLFGGEGLFFATLRGPGKVWIQTLPISRLASRIISYGGGFRRKEEGSVLGGLGNMLDGDGW